MNPSIAHRPTPDWIKSGSLVFDVGAFRGDKTLGYLAAGAEVVAFEPNPWSVRKLNKRCPGAVIVDKALGSEPGKATLMICRKAPAICTLNPDWKQGRFAKYRWDIEIEVDVMTLDQAIELYDVPDYIKIDVEGYEYEVLMGLSAAVAYLSFEFAREFIETTHSCLAYLEGLGYRHFALQIGKSGELGAWMDAERLKAKLVSMPERAWGDIYTCKEDPNE